MMQDPDGMKLEAEWAERNRRIQATHVQKSQTVKETSGTGQKKSISEVSPRERVLGTIFGVPMERSEVWEMLQRTYTWRVM